MNFEIELIILESLKIELTVINNSVNRLELNILIYCTFIYQSLKNCQPINQVLYEMDGFHQNVGVIILSAKNRRDNLDLALLQPGRFDVQAVVPIPDFSGRQEIISMYLEEVLHKDVDMPLLARKTTGLTGADLENMVKQAALRAAIDSVEFVTMKPKQTGAEGSTIKRTVNSILFDGIISKDDTTMRKSQA